ncbi:1-phosphatidylinositol 4,5-bisphosphate phosphodiesterase epsilon-1-like [Rhinatrema bivittatum]|uniref:1-phosphatidylinositol 4,5-bisphosphate phosphodiesterase epsilon-1-like n=1 Tax=Rhinatrema bivittatum TaxID=194408 RepID=UPI00112A7D10|nr:1-phosphatidylinositol 4,5-bisphosphate phosphodiesterase epsilon-1-like [Rhinatrema bivittatum]XP_029465736.1 1-phosphatidylinositol 4,5-bisphosphate phosphodiesterase epsilon-1-like [Rhinatrema bivittatum]XP_029465737.1 1-phosphatidylinositol 4,5-bisphosphate phosphodiesterase epsilon-1-like [Rhinatrema bivittatum]
MTSEEMTVSVLVPLVQGKVIAPQSTGDENSENTLDTNVIKRHTANKERQTADTVQYLHRLKEGYLQCAVPKSLSRRVQESTRNSSNIGLWDRKAFISGSLEYLNINCNIKKEISKSHALHNQFCKSCDSLTGEDPCLEPRTPGWQEETLFAKVHSNMDRPSVKMAASRIQSTGNEYSKSDDNLHFSCVSEKAIAESLCTTHNSFILSNCLHAIGKDLSDSSSDCACKLMDLTNGCENINGQQIFKDCKTLKDQYLCMENISEKVKMPSWSGGNFCGNSIKSPSKLFPSHFEECENCEEEIEDDLCRNKKERSTLLIRRFCKNYREIKKSVYIGTRAIVRTLPSGRLGDKALIFLGQKSNGKNELKSCRIKRGHTTNVQDLIIRQDFSSYLVKAVCQQICKTVREGEKAADPVPRFLSFLESTPAPESSSCGKDKSSGVRRCAQGLGAEFRATSRRTTVSSFITGALLEATASLGARSGSPNLFGGSAGRTMLKGNHTCKISLLALYCIWFTVEGVYCW